MLKVKLLTVAISAAISFSPIVNANLHGSDGIQHQQRIDKKIISPAKSTLLTIQGINTKSFKSIIKQSAKVASDGDIVPNECTPDEFALYSGDDLVEYLSNAHTIGPANEFGYDCFRSLFGDYDNAPTIFSATNIDAVVTSILDDLDNNVSGRETFGKIMYLRTMYYTYFYGDGEFTISTSVEVKLRQALDIFFTKYDGSSTDRMSTFIVAETNLLASSYFVTRFSKIDSTDAEYALLDDRRASYADTVLPRLITILNNSKPNLTADFEDEIQYGLYNQANSVMLSIAMALSYDNDGVLANTDLPSSLAEYSWNVTVRDPVGPNALASFIALLDAPTLSTELIEAVQSVIDNVDKFSSHHIGLLGGVDRSSFDCEVFERDLLCSTDEMIAEMRTFALPDTYTFGDITIKTKMTEERTRDIYNALQATRSQFFRDTGVTEAVANDPNEKVTFIIYGSPEDYAGFQPYLYNLPTDNGGIYIESDGNLYTYDRPDTEMFVLEELARHEYAHYLIGRYLINGMWGDTPMYDDNRLVWFDEGLANYITGATQAEGASPLATMIELNDNANTTRTISEITRSSYGDNWMYPKSALLFNYFDSVGSDALVLLSAALVADDSDEFDSLATSLSSMDAGFQTYIDGLSATTLEAPWWNYKVDAMLEDDNITNIQTVLTDAFSTAATCIEVDESNFSCSFAIDASGSTFSQVEITNSTLNAGILTALQTGPNNIETMTCHPTTLGSTAECIGLLRPDGIEYDDGSIDTDGDGVADEDDAFPNDPTEWADTDQDGTGDNSDVFPNDPTEWADTDQDGTGDNSDVFPNDPTEWADTDGDTHGDNSDAFPNDPTEWLDTDQDGTGDNSDAFPNDASETTDTDGDSTGDNADAFPNDATEWVDSDGDTYGDNSDFYPSDASKWQQETTPVVTPPAAKSSSSGGSFGFSLMLMMLIGITRFRRK